MITPPRSYEEACRLLRWRVPQQLNAAVEAVDRQAWGSAEGHRTALIAEDEGGVANRYTFLDLSRYSNRLANLLVNGGVKRGDRVALRFNPCGEAAVAMLAVLKLGAIAVPLSPAMPEETVHGWLARLDVRAALGDRAQAELFAEARARRPGLIMARCSGASVADVDELWTSLIPLSDDFAAVETLPTDPAFIFCRGEAKTGIGLIHGHRAIRARLSGLEFSHQDFPQVGDVIWTPADWAEDGAWLDTLLPAWELGVTVVATPARRADLPGLLSRWGIRNVQLEPRHLPLLGVAMDGGFSSLRTVVVNGECTGLDIGWIRERLGKIGIRSWGGPMMANLLSRSVLFRCPKGAYGRPPPGYAIDVVDRRGRVLAAGEVGDLALNINCPVMPLGLLGGDLPRRGAWMVVGGRARKDLDGTFWPETPFPDPVTPPPSPTRPKTDGAVTLRAPDPDERWR